MESLKTILPTLPATVSTLSIYNLEIVSRDSMSLPPTCRPTVASLRPLFTAIENLIVSNTNLQEVSVGVLVLFEKHEAPNSEEEEEIVRALEAKGILDVFAGPCANGWDWDWDGSLSRSYELANVIQGTCHAVGAPAFEAQFLQHLLSDAHRH